MFETSSTNELECVCDMQHPQTQKEPLIVSRNFTKAHKSTHVQNMKAYEDIDRNKQQFIPFPAILSNQSTFNETAHNAKLGQKYLINTMTNYYESFAFESIKKKNTSNSQNNHFKNKM